MDFKAAAKVDAIFPVPIIPHRIVLIIITIPFRLPANFELQAWYL
jgi:hypothetical protein